MKKTNPGAALALLRKRHYKYCLICGKRYAAYAISIFCSNRCRQRNKYRKIKELAA